LYTYTFFTYKSRPIFLIVWPGKRRKLKILFYFFPGGSFLFLDEDFLIFKILDIFGSRQMSGNRQICSKHSKYFLCKFVLFKKNVSIFDCSFCFEPAQKELISVYI